MIEEIKSFGTGIICGIIFSLFNLPIPAPGVLAGILGIIGIFIGYLIISNFR
jgi:XapX domain-containing protein